jgi:dihydroorotate dehydrogenase electron transfer subunit
MTKLTCEDTFVTQKRTLSNGYYSLILGSYSRAAACRPGQFVHIKLPQTDIFFRRAFSVAGVSSDGRAVEILVKVFGRGSALLAALRKGDRVNLLGPLGVPFTLPKRNETTLLVAGGIGVPPLLFLANKMVKSGYDPKRIDFFYGGATSLDLIECGRIKKLGVNFRAVTEDGSLGEPGLVTEHVERRLAAHRNDRLRIYACGPEGMLKAVNDLGITYAVPGQLSLEAPLPCGIGVCLGCVVELVNGGHARVCCDGPVFDIGEVVL